MANSLPPSLLSLSDNELTTLPDNIGNLGSLEELFLESNQLITTTKPSLHYQLTVPSETSTFMTILLIKLIMALPSLYTGIIISNFFI